MSSGRMTARFAAPPRLGSDGRSANYIGVPWLEDGGLSRHSRNVHLYAIGAGLGSAGAGSLCVLRVTQTSAQAGRDREACHASVFSPRTLVRRKYHLLYSPRKRPAPWTQRSPSKKLIGAVIEMKRRNPRFGCRKIAEQITSAFGIEINKDVVRRILIQHYRPGPSGDGPSWLTVIGHAKDSLWSVDFFRCESMLLKSYWIMVMMDVFTRRIVGFGVAPADALHPS
jgi:hypothetical protein